MTWLGRVKMLMWGAAKSYRLGGCTRKDFAYQMAPLLGVSPRTVLAWIDNWRLWDDRGPLLLPRDNLPPHLGPVEGEGLTAWEVPLEWFRSPGDSPPC